MLRIEFIINQMLENVNEAELMSQRDILMNLDKLLPAII